MIDLLTKEEIMDQMTIYGHAFIGKLNTVEDTFVTLKKNMLFYHSGLIFIA